MEDNRCKDHPDAPHGFDRNASHSAGRYVCECEFWEPQGVKIHTGPYGEAWIAQDGPLLATKREWVGLTDDDYEELLRTRDWGVCLIEAVEAKLKEKNNG